MVFSSFVRCTVHAVRLRQGMWLAQDLLQDRIFGKRASGGRQRAYALIHTMPMQLRSVARAPMLARALGVDRRLTTCLHHNCNRAFALRPSL